VKDKLLVLAALMAAFIRPAAASPSDDRFAASLLKLDPNTRLEQACDYEAMKRIDRDPNPYHPDRAKTDVISTPQHVGDTVKGNGGAFRSQGQWYTFSFVCKGAPDHLRVLSFTYTIGKLIPESKWASYGLWR
jgi:hypothetical protein